MNSLGLAPAYNRRDKVVHKYCRRVLALPLLPAHEIRDALNGLSIKATTPELSLLNEYITKTWLDSPLWQPESWSCYRQSVRTNNDVEAWHARLSRRTGTGNLGLYQLAGRLHDEAKLVALSMNVMPEAGVVRYQRSTTLRINARLAKLYDEYDAGTRSAKSLLRACSSLYAPAAQ